MNHAAKYRRKVLSCNTEVKEVRLCFIVIFRDLSPINRRMGKLHPLHAAYINELDTRSNSNVEIITTGAINVVSKNMIPPALPRLSTGNASEKYARQKGMPIPSEKPAKATANRATSGEKTVTYPTRKDAKVPSNSQT
jgi:hypothetical protein